MSEEQAGITEAIQRIYADKWVAHEVVFKHRHQLNGKQVPSAPFHHDFVDDFWSSDQYSQILAFRGSAKSTYAEEDIALAVVMRVYRNILIIGSSEARAAERLAAVAYELSQNEPMLRLFGEQKSPDRPWTQTRLVTAYQCCVQALGRDQDIRGIKFLDFRPDFVLVDDFEDKDSVQTPEGRAKTMRWFLTELLPACAPHCRVRIRATPMNIDSVPMQLSRLSTGPWPTRTIPIEYLDEKGRRCSSWPEAYSMQWIARRRAIYEGTGELGAWDREYMCRAVSDADQVFKKEMFRTEPRIKTYEACYGMIDPARTIGTKSAMTGWAVFSWVGNRLWVWAADGQMLLPDEIVALGYDIYERFDLIHLGAEIDGVHQWLLQPFRQEGVRRGIYLPLKGTKAIQGTQGRGQTDFIRGLQPFFSNREVIFTQDLPVLTEQLLNFPTGRRDVPNALAYAMLLRPGLPIYENFTPEHIVESPDPVRDRPVFLVANATPAMTVAALCQAADGKLTVFRDWVMEGGPPELVPIIYSEAMQLAGERMHTVSRPWDGLLKGPVPDRILMRPEPPQWIVPPHHSERYTNVGLAQAVKQIPADLRFGGEETKGQAHLHDLLGRLARGLPAVEIGTNARWTLRALSGGYTRALVRGRLQDYPEEGPYRLLMEGIESFCGLLRAGLAQRGEVGDSDQPMAFTRDGRAYRSAMPQRER